MTKELPGGNSLFDMVYAMKNLLISYLTTVILLFITAVAATYLTVPDSALDILVAVVTAACVMWGGFRAARHLGKQGLLSGALSGLIYMVLLYFIGSLIFGELSFETATALSLVIGIGCGAIGGIIGVNTKPKKRR